ncbi:Rho binding incomplete domain containing protein [Pandoravirus neocaledonia]|uniref:Rho binding incomplete domain containing protein n=1 Tax=Pandoravirus neocaledonia TaxID=2107708 RepID=A0A2U7UAZ4_9VIRU|nr:Rho binding incomplete domain containing protein [Pandoravirus neocaledonia]AVK75623.1 Rho binding incomplete domain containing protein [Pandoravirus neocaledonia]
MSNRQRAPAARRRRPVRPPYPLRIDCDAGLAHRVRFVAFAPDGSQCAVTSSKTTPAAGGADAPSYVTLVPHVIVPNGSDAWITITIDMRRPTGSVIDLTVSDDEDDKDRDDDDDHVRTDNVDSRDDDTVCHRKACCTQRTHGDSDRRGGRINDEAHADLEPRRHGRSTASTEGQDGTYAPETGLGRLDGDGAETVGAVRAPTIVPRRSTRRRRLITPEPEPHQHDETDEMDGDEATPHSPESCIRDAVRQPERHRVPDHDGTRTTRTLTTSDRADGSDTDDSGHAPHREDDRRPSKRARVDGPVDRARQPPRRSERGQTPDSTEDSDSGDATRERRRESDDGDAEDDVTSAQTTRQCLDRGLLGRCTGRVARTCAYSRCAFHCRRRAARADGLEAECPQPTHAPDYKRPWCAVVHCSRRASKCCWRNMCAVHCVDSWTDDVTCSALGHRRSANGAAYLAKRQRLHEDRNAARAQGTPAEP